MPIPGSETYSSTIPVESLTKETKISDDAVPPDVIKGEDWPVQLTLLGLQPDTAPVPGPDQLVVAHGTGFTDKSVIVWNNQDVVTAFVNEGKIKTTISMTAVGVDPVYVRNEDLQSNALSFTFTEAEAKTAKKTAPEEKHAKHGHKKH